MVAGIKPKQEQLAQLTSELALLVVVRVDITRSLATQTTQVKSVFASHDSLSSKREAIEVKIAKARLRGEQ